MGVMGQAGLVLAFAFLGDVLAFSFPIGVPASIWGLLLLFGAMRAGVVKTEWVATAGGFLTANMAFFFLPLAVGIVEIYDLMRPVLMQMLLISVVSTFLSFLAAYHAARIVRRRLAAGRERRQ